MREISQLIIVSSFIYACAAVIPHSERELLTQIVAKTNVGAVSRDVKAVEEIIFFGSLFVPPRVGNCCELPSPFCHRRSLLPGM